MKKIMNVEIREKATKYLLNDSESFHFRIKIAEENLNEEEKNNQKLFWSILIVLALSLIIDFFQFFSFKISPFPLSCLCFGFLLRTCKKAVLRDLKQKIDYIVEEIKNEEVEKYLKKNEI